MEDVLARLGGGGAAEQHELGVVGVVREDGVYFELSEPAGEGDVRGRGDVLVAEHEHLVAYQRLAQRGDGGVVEVVAEVDGADLGADVRGDRRQVERRLGDTGIGGREVEGGGHGSSWVVEDRRSSSAPTYHVSSALSASLPCTLVMRTADVDLHRLRHLIAVAEHGNFGRAAAASYITQPALSRSIQALEAEVGAALFDRRTTGVEPTDMGRLLLRHARALDAGARDLEREIRLTKDLELGELHIGVGPWGGAALVAPVIGRLHAQHPRLRLRVVVAPWRELPTRLRDREVDIVVGALGELEPLAEFATVAFSEHPMIVVGRAGHPLVNVGDVTAADVLTYPLVGPGMDSDAASVLIGLACAADDAPVTTPTATELLTVECDSSDVLKRLLVESDALTFMPQFLVDDELHDGRLAVVDGVDLGLRVRFGAAWVDGRTLGGPGDTFVDLLRTHDQATAGLAE